MDPLKDTAIYASEIVKMDERQLEAEIKRKASLLDFDDVKRIVSLPIDKDKLSPDEIAIVSTTRQALQRGYEKGFFPDEKAIRHSTRHKMQGLWDWLSPGSSKMGEHKLPWAELPGDLTPLMRVAIFEAPDNASRRAGFKRLFDRLEKAYELDSSEFMRLWAEAAQKMTHKDLDVAAQGYADTLKDPEGIKRLKRVMRVNRVPPEKEDLYFRKYNAHGTSPEAFKREIDSDDFTNFEKIMLLKADEIMRLGVERGYCVSYQHNAPDDSRWAQSLIAPETKSLIERIAEDSRTKPRGK